MIKHLRVLIILLFANCYSPVGWSTVPDSLKYRIDSLTALTRSSELEERYAGEFGIAWELYDVDNRYAASYAGRAYKSICEIGDSKRMVRTGRLFGQLLRRVDKSDSAVRVLEEVLLLAESLKDSVEQAKIINAISIVYTYQGRYDQALLRNLRSLEVWRAIHDSAGIAIGLENIGVTYYKMENFQEAERYYMASLQFRNFFKSQNVLTNLALIKIRNGDTTAFRMLSEQAFAEHSNDTRPGICVAYSYGYGVHYQKIKKYDLAISHFHEAMSGARRQFDFRQETEGRLQIAECYARLGRYRDVIRTVDGLEEQLAATKIDPLRLVYYDLVSNALEKDGQVREALRYRKMHQMLNDTVNGQLVMNKVLMARVKFDEEQNRLALSQQAEVISLKEQVISRQQLLLILSGGLLLVLLVLGFVLIRFYRFQKQISTDLDRKVLERTRELELSERELKSNLGQQHALMEMIAAKVQSSIATLRGLCTIQRFEAGGTLDGELDKVATTLMQVPRIIHRSLVNRGGLDGSEMAQMHGANGINGSTHTEH